MRRRAAAIETQTVRISRSANGSRGQDLVEMALVLPLLLALLLGIVEFGVIIWRYNTVSNAAREGARAGVVSDCETGTVISATLRLTTGLDPQPTVVPSSDDGTRCTVAVTYTHSLITGPFLHTAFNVTPTIDLSATSSMIIE